MTRPHLRAALVALSLALSFAFAPTASAQSRTAPPSLEVSLYLLVASADAATPGAKLAPGLDPVAHRLQEVLQSPSVRLASSFLHRVANGGSVEASGLTPPLLLVRTTADTPAFYNLTLSRVELLPTDAGRGAIRMESMRFGMRLPISLGGGSPATYENVGVNVQNGLSFPEGEPTIIGTTSTGRPGETFVLVALVRRAGA
jgi:hypothetical protein